MATLVEASSIHHRLGLKTPFSTWIRYQLGKYQTIVYTYQWKAPRKGPMRTEYLISEQIAKDILHNSGNPLLIYSVEKVTINSDGHVTYVSNEEYSATNISMTTQPRYQAIKSALIGWIAKAKHSLRINDNTYAALEELLIDSDEVQSFLKHYALLHGASTDIAMIKEKGVVFTINAMKEQ